MFTDKLSERRPQTYKSTIQRTHRGIRTAATANCNHAGKEGKLVGVMYIQFKAGFFI